MPSPPPRIVPHKRVLYAFARQSVMGRRKERGFLFLPRIGGRVQVIGGGDPVHLRAGRIGAPEAHQAAILRNRGRKVGVNAVEQSRWVEQDHGVGPRAVR